MRWLWKKSVDDEVREELELHLELRTRELIASGMDPAAAREAALRRFGNLDSVQRTCREIGRKRDKDMRRRKYLAELRQDAGFAVRQLVAHPAFSLIAVLAGRGRIVRQLLTESAVLALVSAAAGLALAWWGMRALVSLIPPGVPRIDQASIDGTVLAFTLGISILSSLVFGCAPVLRAARTSLSEVLKEGGRDSAGTRGRDWLRSSLVAAEVAFAVLLLVGAGRAAGVPPTQALQTG